MARHKSALVALKNLEKSYEQHRRALLRKAEDEMAATVNRMVGELAGIAKDFPKLVSSAVAALVPAPSTPSATKAATAAKAAAPTKRKRGTFTQTAEEMILGLLKGKKASTTEIHEAWKRAGRGVGVDQVLSKMVSAKKLTRKSLGGKMGSEYSAA